MLGGKLGPVGSVLDALYLILLSLGSSRLVKCLLQFHLLLPPLRHILFELSTHLGFRLALSEQRGLVFLFRRQGLGLGFLCGRGLLACFVQAGL